MYQFFVESGQVQGTEIQIVGSDVNHICNVLRMKVGEKIRVSVLAGGTTTFDDSLPTKNEGISTFAGADENDGVNRNIFTGSDAIFSRALEQKSYYARISVLTAEYVLAEIESEDCSGTELNNRICLFQGLPKGDKMELVIQKSVELGVSQIVPVAMKNCVVKLDEKKALSKQQRWQAVSESAAKQSKRTIIPEVLRPVSWKDALALAAKLDVVLVPYELERGMEHTREVIRAIRPGQSVGIVIGPEGGFSPEEIKELPEQMQKISLGKRILRTETAGPALIAMLAYELEDSSR